MSHGVSGRLGEGGIGNSVFGGGVTDAIGALGINVPPGGGVAGILFPPAPPLPTGIFNS